MLTLYVCAVCGVIIGAALAVALWATMTVAFGPKNRPEKYVVVEIVSTAAELNQCTGAATPTR